jgi:hypothetical protein
VLGRLLGAVGEPNDRGPPLPEGIEHRPIHGPAPALERQSGTREIFHTGIKVIDLISKQGDVYIRRLLVLGGTSLVRYARGAGGSVWAKQLLARRPTRIVTVALANKAARVIWALLTRGEVYRAPQPQAA